MNDLVKGSIESRRQAVFSAYNVTDTALIEKIENLFTRITEFGESCTDAMDFETKFASSELNQEYIQLFTEIATSCDPIIRESADDASVVDEGASKFDEIADDIRYEMKQASMPIRRKMRQEAYDTARDIPVIGEIMTAKQHIDFFSRFKKKKEKDEEQDEKK